MGTKNQINQHYQTLREEINKLFATGNLDDLYNKILRYASGIIEIIKGAFAGSLILAEIKKIIQPVINLIGSQIRSIDTLKTTVIRLN
jgi:hypothetical protein